PEQSKLKGDEARNRLVGEPDKQVPPMVADDDVIDPDTGEVYVNAGEAFTKDAVDRIATSTLKEVSALAPPKDPIILESFKDDGTESHEAALLEIYQMLRPGNPPQLEKAKELFREKFQDPNRYRLGKVGRFRINRKFNQEIPETEMVLQALDYLNAIKYILNLRAGEGHI